MSNFPTSANSRVTAPKVETATIAESFDKYIAETQFHVYGGGSTIFLKSKQCLRSWYTALFVEEFNLQACGLDRCPVEQKKNFSLWSDLNDIASWLAIQTVPGPMDENKAFTVDFAKIVLDTFGPTSYGIEELRNAQRRLQSWWDAMPHRWEDKADSCSAYDHGVSFCYFDDLFDYVILYHHDLIIGKSTI